MLHPLRHPERQRRILSLIQKAKGKTNKTFRFLGVTLNLSGDVSLTLNMTHEKRETTNEQRFIISSCTYAPDEWPGPWS